MGIAGKDVHQALLRALEVAKATAVKQHEAHLALESKIEVFATQRADAFLELAKHYLPELTDDKIQQNFRGVQDELRGIAAAGVRERENVMREIRPVQKSCDTLQSQINDFTNQLNLLVQRREQLEEKLSDSLKTHEQFQRLTTNAIETRQILNANAERIKEIRQEAKEKLPAYEASKLFQYLHGRKFGKSNSSGFVMTRSLDDWVARLIGYSHARRSYEFLKVTPELMKLEWERRKDEFRQLRRDIDSLEDKIAEEIGLNAVATEGSQLGEQRDSVIEQLDAEAELLAPLEQKFDDLENTEGEHYQVALERLKEFLNQVRPETLARHIKRTPQEKDDDLLREINWLENEIEDFEKDVRQLRRKRKEATEKAEGLDYVVRRFQRSSFNSERCYFDDLRIDNLLRDYEKDRISQHALLKKIRSEHKFQPTWVDSVSDKAEGALENPISQAVFSAIGYVASTALEQIAKTGKDLPLLHLMDDDFDDDDDDDDDDDSDDSDDSDDGRRKRDKNRGKKRREFSRHRGF
jgi:chromosome segregation ATPase